jgi:signal transduction histidine kinase
MTSGSAPTPRRRTERQGTTTISAGERGAGEREGGGESGTAARVLAGGDVPPHLWRTLHEAAGAACDVLEAAPDGGWPVAELRAHAALLCAVVQQVAMGERAAVGDLSPGIPVRRLLDALRRDFLARTLAEGRAADALPAIRVLDALEQVQEALEADRAHRFASRLAGFDALELVVDVAHDMRSPLGSILFLAERLRKGQSGAVNAIQERQLGLVYSAAFGLSSLASDVIELAKGGDRLVDLHPIPFAVSDIMRAVRDIVLPIAEEKGLSLQFTPPEGDVRTGYPAALNRVLLNLTTNALKFTAEGGVDVTATPRSRTRVEFSVRDSGRGIPEQVMGTLFDAFRRRVKPGEYVFSSAGLGLSICQKLISAMKGELKVETALEKGTRFYFEIDLPLVTKRM